MSFFLYCLKLSKVAIVRDTYACVRPHHTLLHGSESDVIGSKPESSLADARRRGKRSWIQARGCNRNRKCGRRCELHEISVRGQDSVALTPVQDCKYLLHYGAYKFR